MTSLPSGTVTFLFTDIERSTENVAILGDVRYAELLDVHRSLLRQALAAHAGHEVGTEGDAFFVAFARAGDAVSAAADGQRALESHSWPAEARLRVRMGLHTGEALVRGDDYVGHDVHKAKRICDAGHGGQILLSQTTAELVRAEVDVRDLGPHRLKDLAEAQRIYQLVGAGLPSEFPGLRSLDAFKHNLPLQRSAFVGREHEIADIRKQFEAHRLVTLTGIGGCGKTRLALQVGAELIDHYTDGVFFVDLAPISDPGVIARTTAVAVGITQGSGPGAASPQSTMDVLLEFLATRECLLIIDNCEHMLDDCAELVDAILGRCADVSILVTSREALDVEGEQSWRVPSLSVPPTAAQAQDSEAVSLFKTRAQEAEPDFELTPENLDAVVQICRRLDGIPLAIELAAARVSHLSPKQIAERLSDVFRLLTGGRRRVQRQQTLQGALDWSHDLLDDSDRVLLRRLATFAGGFSLDAAEGICADDSLRVGKIVDRLGSLVAKSLVLADRTGDEVRYRLLETVRLYAEEKLREAGEADEFRGRHRDWFFGWVESFPLEEIYWSASTIVRLQREIDNLRAGVEWSDAEGRPELVAPVAGRLLGLWWAGHYEEGTRWLTIALSRPDRVGPRDRSACLICLATTRVVEAVVDRSEYQELTQEAIAASEGEMTPPVVLAKALLAFQSSVRAAANREDEAEAETRRLAAEAIAASELLANPVWSLFARFYSAFCELDLRNIEAANEIFGVLESRLDPARATSLAFMNSAARAVCLYLLGDHAGSVAAARRASAGRDANPEMREMLGYQAEATMALALAAMGDPELAKDRMSDALRIAEDSGAPYVLNEALFFAAALDVELGRFDRASRLLAAGIHPGVVGPASGLRSPPGLVVYFRTVDATRAALGADERKRYREEGREMSLEEAVAYAHEGLAL